MSDREKMIWAAVCIGLAFFIQAFLVYNVVRFG